MKDRCAKVRFLSAWIATGLASAIFARHGFGRAFAVARRSARIGWAAMILATGW